MDKTNQNRNVAILDFLKYYGWWILFDLAVAFAMTWAAVRIITYS